MAAEESGKAAIKNLTAKVLGTLFATVIAPLLVAIVAAKYSNNGDDASKNDPGKPPPAVESAAIPSKAPNPQPLPVEPKESSPVVATAVVSPAKPLPEQSSAVMATPAVPAPKPLAERSTAQTIRLFNGRDLTGLYTYLAAPEGEDVPYGRNKDPKKVVTVRNGLLRISGEVRGVVATEKEFANYRLTVEYKWGRKTWPPREERARTSGILLHCVGPDGAVQNALPQSIKCQIKEGSTGDFILVGGNPKAKVSLTAESEKCEVGEGKRRHFIHRYQPGDPLTTLTGGFILRLGRPMAWKDIKGVRDEQQLEKTMDEWNTLECTCLRDEITVRLNGTTVNVGKKCNPMKGRIAIQSLDAEIFFRTIDLTPLPPARSPLATRK